MKAIASFIIRFRLAFIVVCIAITAFFGFFIKDLRINPDITTYLPKSDSVVARFNYVGKKYAASSLAIVIVENQQGIFNANTIKNINDLTTKFKNTEGVSAVTSITSVLDIKKTADGLEIGRLIDEYNLPQTAGDLQKVKDYALSKSIYKGRLISEDAKITAIVIRLNEDHDKNKVAGVLKQIIQHSGITENTYLDGVPFQLLSIQDYIVKDLMLLTPLIILVIAASLFISFRNLRGVLLPVISVAMGIVWVMGLMGLLGVRLTPISDAIPVVLYAIGSSYGIYIINKFRDTVTNESTKLNDAREALSEVGLAVILSGVTTFFGFLAFVFSAYLNIISEFGIFMALGIVFNLFISVTFIPGVLCYMPVLKKKKTVSKEKGKPGFLVNMLEKIADICIHKSKLVIASTCLIVFAVIFGIPYIKNNIDILNYFRPNTSIRQSAAIMNREFGGSIPVQVLVRGDIQDPEVLSAMMKMQDFLNDQPNAQNAQSVADLIEEMNDCMGEGHRIPDNRAKVSNLWFLIEGEDMLKQMVNEDKTEALISASLVNVDTKRYHAIDAALDSCCAALSNNSVTMQKGGMQSIYSNFDDSLQKNLYESMIISIVLIFLSMIVLQRSLKGALIGMIPLLMTMAFIFGFMGISGIALDIATVLIASITVGVGIDYAIHFVTTYRWFIKQGLDINTAIHQTMATKGKAIAISVITIILGFLILLFANLVPLEQFGILIAVTMFCSGFGAITTLPAVISLLKLDFKKDEKMKR